MFFVGFFIIFFAPEFFVFQSCVSLNVLGIRFEHFNRGHTHINYANFKHPYHAQLWDILENPETSVWAKFISALSMGLTVLSVVLFCLETLPELAYLDVDSSVV